MERFTYMVWSDGTYVLEEDMVHMEHMSDDFQLLQSDEEHIEADVQRLLDVSVSL